MLDKNGTTKKHGWMILSNQTYFVVDKITLNRHISLHHTHILHILL
jgi:hypothetical protein